MKTATQWFRNELDEVRRRLGSGFEALESLLADPQTPSRMLREAFAEVSFDVKRLLALSHFQNWHYDTMVREDNLISTLAYLEGTPITRPDWLSGMRHLKEGVEAVEANPPHFEDFVDRESLEQPDEIYVTGPDRITEGATENSFDLPEAAVSEQVRNEIAMLVNEFWTRIPQAG